MAPSKSKRQLSKTRTPAPRKSKSACVPQVGPAFEKLVAIMARLRAPHGCPWDREQTHATLRTYLIEEAYEVLDALDSTDDAKFAEELGDLLLQVLFHAQIAGEEGRFSISDVINEIYEKMIRRHPHVFGQKRAKDAAEVLRNWEIIKNEERQSKKRSGRSLDLSALPQGKSASPAASSSTSSTSSTSSYESLLDGIPRSLPALLEALQLTRKAARIGFDWRNLNGIFSKLAEETQELQSVLKQCSGESLDPSSRSQGESASPAALSYSTPSSSSSSASANPAISSSAATTMVAPGSSRQTQLIESEVGDILFVAVNLARFLNLDPEIALKKSNTKFSRRFREMERLAREQGTTLAQLPRPQMESLWDHAKLHEHSIPPTEAPK
jgi:nucleoside triphosphate diphosphatase